MANVISLIEAVTGLVFVIVLGITVWGLFYRRPLKSSRKSP